MENELTTKKIGGPGLTVEIDESLISKRKYHRGRKQSGQQWVVGGICRETKDLFIVPVEKRDAPTLTTVILSHVQIGSTVMTDCWKAYGTLSDLRYVHQTVNHSTHFVDPTSGACTNYIENAWRWLKFGLFSTGTKKNKLNGYLFHYMWSKKYGGADRFRNIVKHIALHYPGR